MTYQVGDKVKVREDLVFNKVYGCLAWLFGMDELSGKVLTIIKVYENGAYAFKETPFGLSHEMIECKVELDTKEEDKMDKYNVGDLVEFEDDEKAGIGKIVEVDSGSDSQKYLVELPRNLWGTGHNGNGFSHGNYAKDNYWFIDESEIKCKVGEAKENVATTDEVKRITKGINTLVQDVYRAVQDKKGNIKFNKVKMKNLCFVKFDGMDKVYVFNNPTDVRLDEGTRVLVDSCGRETDATVVSSIKIQNKYVKHLMFAISGRRDLKLKNVLGVYETKTVQVNELTRLGGDD